MSPLSPPAAGSRLYTAAATLTAGLVATSTVALVVVSVDQHSASGSTAVRPDRSLGIAGRAATRSPAAASAPSSSPAATRLPARAVTYRVRRGDNLTAIARWFKLHGYAALYRRNRAEIGANPNLIRPGQVITVSPAGASISR